jgi:hypothetical protein
MSNINLEPNTNLNLPVSYVDKLSNSIWEEYDILAAGRAIIDSVVPLARRHELQTILLGHISQLRSATPQELAEIGEVQAITEQVSLLNEASRLDMLLLNEVLAYESDNTKELSQEGLELYNLRNPVISLSDDVVIEQQPI